MCLPLGCLTFWITASAVICLILGVVAAAVAGVQSGGLLNKYIPEDFQGATTGALYALLAFGILLILIGITGILAGCKKIKCCSIIYMIGMIIFAIIFIAIGIAALAAAGSLGDMRNGSECQSDSIWGRWHKWDAIAHYTLCTDLCPCKLAKDANFTKQIIEESKKKDFDRTFKFEEVVVPAGNSTVNLDAVRFQQCKQYKDLAAGKLFYVKDTDPLNQLAWSEVKQANASNSSANSTGPKRYLQGSGAPASGGNGSVAANVSSSANDTFVELPLNYTFDASSSVFARSFWGSVRNMEEFLKCSGVCAVRPFYSLSDINRGDPEDTCGGMLYDFLKNQGKTIGLVSLLIGLFLLLNFILAICHWKQSSKADGN